MEMIFRAEPKYGGLLVHLDDTDKYDYHTKNPACTGEVVRCRDCKELHTVANIPYCEKHDRLTDLDCYCWWAERRGA